MVLLDDNFASIVAAVEEGRGIFDNIQKVTHYLLSCNAGELILLFFAALVGWPAPLLAVQILWINLITDGVPALALGVEPPERDIMQRRPRPPSEPLITATDALSILSHGFLIAVVAGAGFAWLLGPCGASMPQARAAAFAITAFTQLFFAIGCRSRRYTMPEVGWFTNPALFWAIAASIVLQVGVMSMPLTREFLRTETLEIGHWAVVLLLSLLPVTVVETTKLFRSAIRRRRPLRR
jgi:Ca2+-transporting ATPase